MCLLSLGTGIPQVKDVLLTERSFKPFSTKFTTSFFLEVGKMKSFFLFYNFNNFSPYAESLKKYDSSSTQSTGDPEVFETFFPSTTSISSSS